MGRPPTICRPSPPRSVASFNLPKLDLRDNSLYDSNPTALPASISRDSAERLPTIESCISHQRSPCWPARRLRKPFPTLRHSCSSRLRSASSPQLPAATSSRLLTHRQIHLLTFQQRSTPDQRPSHLLRPRFAVVLPDRAVPTHFPAQPQRCRHPRRFRKVPRAEPMRCDQELQHPEPIRCRPSCRADLDEALGGLDQEGLHGGR